ncbi:hypothetical protein Agabi119p4_10139 [Agaricus bisporus var. burnettii]|uniref:Magnesium-dependent phosphatase-1 n=1 Tax=Agaricus bisporus var. burnettii TaxID=192524 RepID=A0A8H7C2C8_AGABI|nr:hypothetical protein Agabi119p4_10139 [Agaricus bisporus var. burnettii]
MTSSPRYPKLVAFDLDYTLWALWIDTHVQGPLHRNGNNINEVLDRNNDKIEFYKDVPSILHRLRAADVRIAACSRTSATNLAHQALRLLLLPSETNNGQKRKNADKAIPAIDFFDQLEIYPGSKLTHFKKIHEKSGIPYCEMLFFDDEIRNREVERLGVTFELITFSGMTNKALEQGLAVWRHRHPEEEKEEQEEQNQE